MDIYPLGHASFKIKGKGATIVTDPFEPAMVGLKFPTLSDVDIVTVSHGHDDHNAVGSVKGREGKGPFVVSGPGEYEISGVTILGVASFHDDKQGKERGNNTIYRIGVDGVQICHLGDLGSQLSDEQISDLGAIDILFIPVGGFYTIDAATAAKVVAQLEPLIVVPMHYFRPGMNERNFSMIASSERFLSEMGVEKLPPVAKLVTSKDKLPETTTVVVLE